MLSAESGSPSSSRPPREVPTRGLQGARAAPAIAPPARGREGVAGLPPLPPLTRLPRSSPNLKLMLLGWRAPRFPPTPGRLADFLLLGIQLSECRPFCIASVLSRVTARALPRPSARESCTSGRVAWGAGRQSLRSLLGAGPSLAVRLSRGARAADALQPTRGSFLTFSWTRASPVFSKAETHGRGRPSTVVGPLLGVMVTC